MWVNFSKWKPIQFELRHYNTEKSFHVIKLKVLSILFFNSRTHTSFSLAVSVEDGKITAVLAILWNYFKYILFWVTEENKEFVVS